MRKVLLVCAIAAVGSQGSAVGQRKPVVRKAPVTAVTVPKLARAPAPVPVLPLFTFKDAKAGGSMDPTSLGRCEADGRPGKLKCVGKDGMVAGIRLIIPPYYYFYNNRLTSMLFLFNNEGVTFPTLLSAFRERYGAPCKTETEKWQNKAGAVFDNPTVTWCFKTGKLTLESMSTSRDYGDVMYSDDYTGPVEETPKDF